MLTEKEIKSLKAKEKPYKVTDSGGLYIYVLTSGSKSWRIKYRYEGKEKTHTIGLYPAYSLAEARKALADLKLNLKQGLDPSAEKKAEEQAPKNFMGGKGRAHLFKRRHQVARDHQER